MVDYIQVFHTIAGSLDFLVLFGMTVVRKRRWRWLLVSLWAVSCLLVAICFNPLRHGEVMLATLTVWIHLPIVLVGAAILWMVRDGQKPFTLRRGLLGGGWIALAGAIVAIGYYAYRIEPYRLEQTTLRIQSPKIQEKLRVVFVTDLHVSHVGTYEREVLRKIAAAKPDLLILGGDTFQPELEDVTRRHGFQLRGDFRRAYRWRQEVGRDFQKAWEDAGILPPLGTWAVCGNHDAMWRVEPPISGVKWGWETDSVPLRQDLLLTLLSVSDSRDVTGDTVYPDYSKTMLDSRFQIVVGHHPNPAENPTLRGDLFLAGHTHGGQVQIPGVTDLARYVFGLFGATFSFQSGRLVSVSGVDTYISKGVGIAKLDAPRFRLNCPPEFLLLELEPATQPNGKEDAVPKPPEMEANAYGPRSVGVRDGYQAHTEWRL